MATRRLPRDHRHQVTDERRGDDGHYGLYHHGHGDSDVHRRVHDNPAFSPDEAWGDDRVTVDHSPAHIRRVTDNGHHNPAYEFVLLPDYDDGESADYDNEYDNDYDQSPYTSDQHKTSDHTRWEPEPDFDMESSTYTSEVNDPRGSTGVMVGRPPGGRLPRETDLVPPTESRHRNRGSMRMSVMSAAIGRARRGLRVMEGAEGGRCIGADDARAVEEGAGEGVEDEDDELVAKVLDQADEVTMKQLHINTMHKEQLRTTPTVKPTGYEKWKLERKRSWKRTKLKLREFASWFELWRSSFKTIEAHFGSAVLSYFLFIKWLLLVNAFTGLIIISVIVLPQSLMEPHSFNASLALPDIALYSERQVFLDQAVSCSEHYDDVLSNQSTNRPVDDLIIDFFQGTGWMEQTPLFIGFYFNKTFVFDKDREHYNMPLAYLLATAAYMLVTLIAMVRYTAAGLRSRLASSSGRFHHYFNSVFCGWDYSVTELKAADHKHRGLRAEYMNDVEEQRQAKRRAEMDSRARCAVYTVRVFVWLGTFVILGAAGFLVYLVVAVWMPDLMDRDDVQNNRFLMLLVEFMPSITITALNIIIPPVFTKMVEIEDYSPENEIRFTIGRTVFLRLASVAVLMVTVALQISTCDRVCGSCEALSPCWETYMGQQIYKLVILDFIVNILIVFVIEFPRRLLVKKFPKNKLLRFVGLQEFDIPRSVLDIVYTQTISWFGGFFSPLIPVVTVMKLFIFFYVKKISLLRNCVPSSRVHRASRSSHFFIVILMIAYVMCVFAISYAIGRMRPSQGCSPFRVYSSENHYMFSSVSDALRTLPKFFTDVLFILGSGLFYIALLVLLLLVIYYYRAVAAGNKYLARLLEDQLALEGKDRQFLLTRVNEALNLT